MGSLSLVVRPMMLGLCVSVPHHPGGSEPLPCVGHGHEQLDGEDRNVI